MSVNEAGRRAKELAELMDILADPASSMDDRVAALAAVTERSK
jgi:hypothetical protein